MLQDECGGIDMVGEYITIFHPKTNGGSEKRPQIVLCQTAKKNLSLFLVDGSCERISLNKTILMTS